MVSKLLLNLDRSPRERPCRWRLDRPTLREDEEEEGEEADEALVGGGGPESLPGLKSQLEAVSPAVKGPNNGEEPSAFEEEDERGWIEFAAADAADEENEEGRYHVESLERVLADVAELPASAGG
mmetsp:Transcript_22461/g.49230  ORF Transcript_22461/g.49230 Transcript_22461/m.49230 type:complete len:125 (+) Transcript_22461:173-547(+)